MQQMKDAVHNYAADSDSDLYESQEADISNPYKRWNWGQNRDVYFYRRVKKEDCLPLYSSFRLSKES